MWDTLTWRDLRTPEIRDEIDELRARTVQLLTGMVAVGYLGWHLGLMTLFSTLEVKPDTLRYWLYFPIVAIYLGANYLLQRRQWRWMTEFFLASSVLALVGGIWLLESPYPAILFPLLTLAAVVLLHPLAGLAIGSTSVGLLVTLSWAGPLAFLDSNHLVAQAVSCLLTVAVAWALGRNLVIAVRWSLDSYAQALRNAEDARNHRAELFQALKQLDNAYYRLERANAALELAWRAAEVAERSKSEFVTNISHELRTPLNLIVGFSEMILTSPESYGVPLPAAYRGDLNAIYRSAQHLLTLTEDVLDLARVGIGRLSLAREPVDLGQVIRDAAEIVREYVAAKKLRLDLQLSADLPMVNVDRLRIRQVLLNLLTNAARFTQTGGITILAFPEDHHVVVRVTDTGQGIAPNDLPKIFDEFFHVDAADTSHHHLGGVGLGLPLSRRLIEMHGGSMGVDSTLGVGTTFWFTVPVLGEGRSSEGESWRMLRVPVPPHPSERVLVLLGDDRQLGEFLEHHLRGYRVIGASDLSSAVRTAIEYRAAAVLIDADQIIEAPPDDLPVPIIRLPFPHVGRLAAAFGVAAYLVKPITRTQLQDAVTSLQRPVRTALIVDDDPRFVRLVRRYLRWIVGDELQHIFTAHSGEEALRIVQEIERPDLLLLDLAMGEVSGDDVLKALAKDGHLDHIAVILLSARAPGETQRPLSGAVSVLKSEGFHLEELLATVEAILGALHPPRRYLAHAPTLPSATGGSG